MTYPLGHGLGSEGGACKADALASEKDVVYFSECLWDDDDDICEWKFDTSQSDKLVR